MTILREIFNPNARTGASQDSDAAADTNAAASSTQSEALTYERKDNPFASLMRQFEKLVDADPKEAMRLILNIREGKLFSKPHEVAKIEAALTQVIGELNENDPLCAAFTKGALAVQASAPQQQPGAPVPALLPILALAS